MKTLWYSSLWIVLILTLSPLAEAQNVTRGKNNTVQIINAGFEDYDNFGNKEIEPVGWNSFMTANANLITGIGKACRLSRSDDKRPQSNGSYSVRIFSDNPIGSTIANGNLTTGRINMGSTSPTDASNHNFTDRGASGFYLPFTDIPDSLVIWVKYSPKGNASSASNKARVSAVLHNNNNTRDPGYNNSQVVAIAEHNFSSNGNSWQRLSIPFVKTGSTLETHYMLISLTTNFTPGGGSNNDEVWFDDILFIYNPTIDIKPLVTYSMPYFAGETIPLDVTYEIKGIMSPNNLDPDNQVRIELSDADGSFSSPIVIGQESSDISGTLSCVIPADLSPSDKYRLRMVTTNYPLVKEHGTPLELYEAYRLVRESQNHRGSVSGSEGSFRVGSNVSVRASVHNTASNHFVGWFENGQLIPEAASTYTFPITRHRHLIAHFDTNRYQIDVAIVGQGSVEGGNGSYPHDSTVSLNATPKTGFKFSRYTDGALNLSTNPQYSFLAKKDILVQAVFEAQTYNIILSASNAAHGSVQGAGTYAHGDSCRAVAIPKNYYEFVGWTRGRDTVSKDSLLIFEVTGLDNLVACFREYRYRIDLVVEPAGYGQTTGQGTYNASQIQTIELKAKAETGKEFIRWEKLDTDPLETSTQNPWTILNNGRLGASAHYKAVFDIVGHDIKVTLTPPHSGSISGAVRYPHGNTAELSATANPGYEFVSWTEAEGFSSTDNPLRFVVDKPRTLHAVFRLKTYAVQADVNDPSMGSVSGAGTYAHFDTAVMVATALPGYECRCWTDGNDTLSKNRTLRLAIDRPRTVKAHFTYVKKRLQVQAVPEAGGSVSGAGVYEHGELRRVNMSPNYGFSFSQWSSQGVALDNRAFIDIKLTQDTVIHAEFSRNNYKITINSLNNNGQVRFVSDNEADFSAQADQSIPYGDSVSIEAQAITEGYRFIGWSINGNSVSNSRVYRLAVERHTILSANFSNTTREVAATVHPEGSGRVLNTGNHMANQPVELIAEAITGYQFDAWKTTEGEPLSKDPHFFFTITRDTAFEAHFSRQSFHVFAKSSPAIWTSTIDESIVYQEAFSHTAPEITGYRFLGWWEAETLLTTEPELSLLIDHDLTLEARYDTLQYQITLSEPLSTEGLVSGAGTYRHFQRATVMAKPAHGFIFTGWWEAETLVSDADTLSWIVSEPRHLEARFKKDHFLVSLNTETPQMGSIEGEGTFEYLDSATVKAHPHDGYHFKGWYDGEELLSTDSILKIEVAQDRSLQASFETNYYNLSLQTEDEALGYTLGEGSFPYLKKVRVQAIPSYGYDFEAWYDPSGQQISILPIFEIVMGSDTLLEARFKIRSWPMNVISDNTVGGHIEIITDTDTDLAKSYRNGILTHGQSFIAIATPNRGYTFSHWTLNDVRHNSGDTLRSTVEGPIRLKAFFNKKSHTLLVESTESNGGTVSGSGMYYFEDTVTVDAQARDGYHFVEWQEDGLWFSDSTTLSLVIQEDMVLRAVFELDRFMIEAHPSDLLAGSVSGSGEYDGTQTVRLEATAEDAYLFKGWVLDDAVVTEQNPYSFLATANATYTALFEPKKYQVGTSVRPETGGLIEGGGEYQHGQSVFLVANPDSLFTFAGWALEDPSYQGPLSEYLTEDLLRWPKIQFPALDHIRLVAKFKKYNYLIDASVSPLGSGSVANTGTYDAGSTAELIAEPYDGYRFNAWLLDGVEMGHTPKISIGVDGGMNVVASFEKERYSVNLRAYPSAGGTSIGAGQYYYQDSVEIIAVTNPGYRFMEWSNAEGLTHTTDSVFKVVVDKAHVFTAMYSKTTSVCKPIEAEKLMVVSPNPAKDRIRIQGPEFVGVQVFNANGRLIHEQWGRSQELKIDAHTWPKGYYLLRIHLSHDRCETHKVIISE